MKIDLVTLIVGIVPAVISYFIAVKNANSKIESIKEETERDIKSIRADTEREIEKIYADTQREIEKIKADTEREIEKINAETESQIRIMEAQSKAKENEKINDILYDKLGEIFGNILTDPKTLLKLLEISTKSNPTDEDYLNLMGINLNGKNE